MLSSILVGCGSSEQLEKQEETGITSTTEETETATEDKSADPVDYKVVMVVKQSDSWFDDMASGVE